jgi:hypothetical protein
VLEPDELLPRPERAIDRVRAVFRQRELHWGYGHFKPDGVYEHTGARWAITDFGHTKNDARELRGGARHLVGPDDHRLSTGLRRLADGHRRLDAAVPGRRARSRPRPFAGRPRRTRTTKHRLRFAAPTAPQRWPRQREILDPEVREQPLKAREQSPIPETRRPAPPAGRLALNRRLVVELAKAGERDRSPLAYAARP